MRYRMLSIVALAILVIVAIPFANADDEPTPHQLIDRALKAGGGIEKIRQFKAVAFKANLSFGNKTKAKMTGTVAHATLFHVAIESDGIGDIVLVGGGDTLWTKLPNEAAKKFSATDKEIATELGVFYACCLPDLLTSLKGKGYKLTIVGDQAVNGVKAVAMRVQHELHPEITIWFDKENGLPVKTRLKLQEDSNLIEVHFDDYKEFDGVKHFTKFKLHSNGESCVGELREIRLLKSVDSKLFKSP
jgi:outer membrane lipoprotein-sorting protein